MADNQYKRYSLSSIIDSISIQGNGTFTLNSEETESPLKDSVSLNVAGNGDIVLSNFRKLSVIAAVVGNGDITLRYVNGPSLNAMVTGNGDIKGAGSSFNSINKNVVGNGDITGF